MSSDMGVDGAYRLALASSFYKKLAPGGNSQAADAAALEKFRAVNVSLPVDSFRFEAASEVESAFWDYFADHFNQVVGPREDVENFDLDYVREHMNVGPGAAQKADSRTLVTKLFESAVSYTDDHLIRLYRGALVETGLWADAEMHRFERFGFTRVRGGKLFFAPKNAEISRTCCTEPNLNMLFQKAIGSFLEMRLAHFFGIRLDTEPTHNQELARLGSVDGSFGTIDLASASDSIGLQMMHSLMRPGALKALMMLSRCERAVLPDGEESELRMISTMGNGFTFPLQTVIFACAVRSVYDLMGLPMRDPISGARLFGVFGDDIVIVRSAFEFTTRMLAKLGFVVNVGKSFNSGPFRESCGHDYYAGTNVRGVYVRSLEIPQQVYSLINRLNRWSARAGIELPQTLSLLLTWVRDLRVPPSEPDDAGIHVPFKSCKPQVSNEYWFKYRCYVRRLQRFQVLEADDPQTINPYGTGVGFLSRSYRRPDLCVSTDDPTWSAWQTNGWAVSATLRDMIGARARYKIVTRKIPWWDYLPDPKMAEWYPWEDPGARDESFEALEWRIPLTRDSYPAWQARVAAWLDTV
jgi:hypothetical protein